MAIKDAWKTVSGTKWVNEELFPAFVSRGFRLCPASLGDERHVF